MRKSPLSEMVVGAWNGSCCFMFSIEVVLQEV